MQNTNEAVSEQAWEGITGRLRGQLETFLKPLLVAMDKRIDKRLVRTAVLFVGAIIDLRHPGNGLVLRELGATFWDLGRCRRERNGSATCCAATNDITG